VQASSADSVWSRVNTTLAVILVVLWGFGVVFFTMCFNLIVEESDTLRTSLFMQPWGLVLASLFCVAWPGVILASLLIASVNQVRGWKKRR